MFSNLYYLLDKGVFETLNFEDSIVFSLDCLFEEETFVNPLNGLSLRYIPL